MSKTKTETNGTSASPVDALVIRDVELAEQQLLGFAHGKAGYSIKQLVEAMGLKKEEWEYIKANYPKYLPDSEIEVIDELLSV